MLCSTLLLHGIDHLRVVRAGIERWMESRDYLSVSQMKGSMDQRSCADPTAFERANYVKAVTGYHITG
jgi:dihydroorotate dehydrogenase (fumarate)